VSAAKTLQGALRLMAAAFVPGDYSQRRSTGAPVFLDLDSKAWMGAGHPADAEVAWCLDDAVERAAGGDREAMWAAHEALREAVGGGSPVWERMEDGSYRPRTQVETLELTKRAAVRAQTKGTR
jgi:hypothetical protein